jgi:hypothetical protein
MLNRYYFLFSILILLCSNRVYSQISPGDLTKAHSHLEGLSNCTKCHQLGEQVNNSKCLECHTEIKELISSNRGYHSDSEVKGKNCWNCHSEHHGRNFRIINFDPEKFNHDKTGFGLTGSHKNIECSSCHKSDFIINSKLKKKNKTFLGLNTQCQSCHEDYHQGTLSSDCINCHNTQKFRPAVGFDHNKTRFRLTGKHEIVECIKCHIIEKKNGKDFQKFNDLNFSSCSSCHNDVHKGIFGNDCKSCHSTSGFKIINRSAFDHSKTQFPLVGKHQIVKCNDCHKSGLSVKPAYSKCIDCHSDYHKGEFIVNGVNRDCKECHTEFGFSPSQFSIEDHNILNYKLTGAHLALPCKGCHGKNDTWHFRNIGRNCFDCHNNVHGAELTPEYLPENKCDNCHNTLNWSTIQFDHKRTAFELVGKHSTVSCIECHATGEENTELKYKFASLKSDCDICHKDIHFGQFISDGKNDCRRCHGFNDWNPGNFDHNKTRFSLEGAHSKLDCSKCHKTVNLDQNTFIKFKLEDFKCAACHS